VEEAVPAICLYATETLEERLLIIHLAFSEICKVTVAAASKLEARRVAVPKIGIL